MCRDQHPSLETRVAGIEATQKSMQSTLAELSTSVAQLVQLLTSVDVKKGEKILKDKCSSDEPLQKKKTDDNDGKDGRKKAGGSVVKNQLALLKISTNVNSDKSNADQRSNKDVNSDKETKQTLEMVVSPIQNLTDEAEKLIKAGNPESHKFCQTLKYKGKETTLFYKSPSLQLIDEVLQERFIKERILVSTS